VNIIHEGLCLVRSAKNGGIFDVRKQIRQQTITRLSRLTSRIDSPQLYSGCFINGRTYIGIPLDLDPRPPRNTTRRFDEICRLRIPGRAFNLLESLFWMGPLDQYSSAHIGNYPLAFVGSCPSCPKTPRRHYWNHLRELPDRRLSLFSFFLFTAVSIFFGYLRNSADGSYATTETLETPEIRRLNEERNRFCFRRSH